MKCYVTDDLSLFRPLEGPWAAHIGRLAHGPGSRITRSPRCAVYFKNVPRS